MYGTIFLTISQMVTHLELLWITFYGWHGGKYTRNQVVRSMHKLIATVETQLSVMLRGVRMKTNEIALCFILSVIPQNTVRSIESLH